MQLYEILYAFEIYALLFSLLSIAGDPVTLEDVHDADHSVADALVTLLLRHASRRCRTLFALSPRCYAPDSPLGLAAGKYRQATVLEAPKVAIVVPEWICPCHEGPPLCAHFTLCALPFELSKTQPLRALPFGHLC